ncbi:MAG TPA: hypothetical protein VLW25_12515 [Bryobacteraceae bacterium]|nr:hypothetical protein [Bryobacteraceae bacterium]
MARFWLLSEMLGPVKASSFRLASRIANSLRAGYPVKDYGEFDACHMILISVPDDALEGVVAELCSAGISWRGKSVVLCSAWRDSSELGELSARGAAIGSITTIPGFHDLRYLVSGDKRAIQESKRLVENRERRCLTIERGRKPLYLAALTCTGSLLFPLVMAASESLRRAGVTPAVSFSILEKQLTIGLRAYARGGRRAYAPPRELTSQLRALWATDPALAYYMEKSSQLAAQLLEQPRHKAAAAGAPAFSATRDQRFPRRLVATRR